MLFLFWFHVSFDQENVYLNVNPPGEEGWKAQFQWKDIIRVCYRPYSYFATDEIYIFTNKRPESYVIPTECLGGSELWGEIVSQNLFPADLAIKVVSSSSNLGELYCWPPVDNDTIEE